MVKDAKSLFRDINLYKINFLSEGISKK